MRRTIPMGGTRMFEVDMLVKLTFSFAFLRVDGVFMPFVAGWDLEIC